MPYYHCSTNFKLSEEHSEEYALSELSDLEVLYFDTQLLEKWLCDSSDLRAVNSFLVMKLDLFTR